MRGAWILQLGPNPDLMTVAQPPNCCSSLPAMSMNSEYHLPGKQPSWLFVMLQKRILKTNNGQ